MLKVEDLQCISKKLYPWKFKVSSNYCINLTALNAWSCTHWKSYDVIIDFPCVQDLLFLQIINSKQSVSSKLLPYVIANLNLKGLSFFVHSCIVVWMIAHEVTCFKWRKHDIVCKSNMIVIQIADITLTSDERRWVNQC